MLYHIMSCCSHVVPRVVPHLVPHLVPHVVHVVSVVVPVVHENGPPKDLKNQRLTDEQRGRN